MPISRQLLILASLAALCGWISNNFRLWNFSKNNFWICVRRILETFSNFKVGISRRKFIFSQRDLEFVILVWVIVCMSKSVVMDYLQINYSFLTNHCSKYINVLFISNLREERFNRWQINEITLQVILQSVFASSFGKKFYMVGNCSKRRTIST